MWARKEKGVRKEFDKEFPELERIFVFLCPFFKRRREVWGRKEKGVRKEFDKAFPELERNSEF